MEAEETTVSGLLKEVGEKYKYISGGQDIKTARNPREAGRALRIAAGATATTLPWSRERRQMQLKQSEGRRRVLGLPSGSPDRPVQVSDRECLAMTRKPRKDELPTIT